MIKNVTLVFKMYVFHIFASCRALFMLIIHHLTFACSLTLCLSHVLNLSANMIDKAFVYLHLCLYLLADRILCHHMDAAGVPEWYKALTAQGHIVKEQQPQIALLSAKPTQLCTTRSALQESISTADYALN